MDENKYSVEVKWSPQDDCFIATCPAFAGLSAFGDTRLEALNEFETALELFIEDYKDEGEELPEPNTIDY